MSPVPSAASPGPIGMSVPISPSVGPILVIMSVLSSVFWKYSSLSSISLRAMDSLDLGGIWCVWLMVFSIFFCVVGSWLWFIMLVVSVEFFVWEIWYISWFICFALGFFRLENSFMKSPTSMTVIANIMISISSTGRFRLSDIMCRGSPRNDVVAGIFLIFTLILFFIKYNCSNIFYELSNIN